MLPPTQLSEEENGTHDFDPLLPEKKLLYIGTYAVWQGLHTLLRALHLLVDDQNREEALSWRPKLYVMGRGRKAQFKQMLKLIRKLGLQSHVTFIAAVPHQEVAPFIQAADLCIAPLGYNDRNVTQGCCPLKLLEYMACGRPILASDLPVVRELIMPEREGVLVEPDRPDQLALAIEKLLNNPNGAEILGRQAAKRIQDRYSWSIAQEQLIQTVDKLIG